MLGAALTQILSQTLLVCVLLAVGRGLGAVADIPPRPEPILPLALSFLAIPFCRMFWDFGEAAKIGVFDAEAEAAHAPRAASHAASAIVPLLNLADDMADSLTTDAVAKVMEPAGRVAAEGACRRTLSSGPQPCRPASRACPLGDGTGNCRVGRVEWRHGQRL